jgi:hypothetical protein
MGLSLPSVVVRCGCFYFFILCDVVVVFCFVASLYAMNLVCCFVGVGLYSLSWGWGDHGVAPEG